MYSERVGLLSAAAVFIGFVLTFLPFLWQCGHAVGYYSYPPQYQWLHVLATGGSYLLGMAVVLALGNLLVSLRYGPKAPRIRGIRVARMVDRLAAAGTQLSRNARHYRERTSTRCRRRKRMAEPFLAEQYGSLERQSITLRFGMWLFLASELLLFSGFFALYGAYRAMYGRDFVQAIKHNTIAYRHREHVCAADE